MRNTVSCCLFLLLFLFSFARAQKLWVLGSKMLSATFFFCLFLCHFPDSFNTIIRRALPLAAAAAAGRETGDRAREKSMREAEGGDNKGNVCTAFFVTQRGKDSSGERCLLADVRSWHLSPERQTDQVCRCDCVSEHVFPTQQRCAM